MQKNGLFSVRSAGRIGHVIEPIINPHNLHVDGFYCDAVNASANGVIVDIDIREITHRGIIINDHEDIAEADELVRLKPIIDIHFELIGKPVFQNRKKIGKITDYALDSASLYIQKLYVQPPLFQSMGSSQLIIGRSSIVEVTDTRVVVTGNEQKESSRATQAISPPLASLSSSSASTMSE